MKSVVVRIVCIVSGCDCVSGCDTVYLQSLPAFLPRSPSSSPPPLLPKLWWVQRAKEEKRERERENQIPIFFD
jgi:hypothetical protein